MSLYLPTLSDWAKRSDEGGRIDDIAEMLTLTNDVLDDMQWQQGNLPTGHRTTVRSGLPDVAWRKLNYGVQPSKSRTVQITDSCGMLEAYAEVDKSLVDLAGGTGTDSGDAFRWTEDLAFVESMNQTMAETLFYGDTSIHPERFLGLAPRYNDLSAENGDNIIDAGGTGSDNWSIWLVGWGANTVFGTFPKGATAGLMQEDLGRETLTDENGGRFEGYRTHYKWDAGLVVRDWRYVVRIANIDQSNMETISNVEPLIDLMTDALAQIPSPGMAKLSFYMPKRLQTQMQKAVRDKAKNTLTQEQVSGKKFVAFDGIPVRRVDALTSEARVT